MLHWNNVTQHAQIPFGRLGRIVTKTEEEVHRDVTLGRLLLFNVLAFGMKKRWVTRKKYTIIKGQDENNRPVHAVLDITPNWEISGASPKINNARQKYLDEHPEEAAQAAQLAPEDDSPGNETAPAPDPIAQIEKLKGLLDSGAIKQDEFEAKKAELLKRI
jgi:hypothetical protein